MARLQIVDTFHQVAHSELELDVDEVLVGRALECEVRTSNTTIARRHARIFYDHLAEAWRIEELVPANGVWVNYQRIPGTATLRDRDEI
jgi:pSer/pThr/pTyr-binding forkhead associated (FHA) protein